MWHCKWQAQSRALTKSRMKTPANKRRLKVRWRTCVCVQQRRALLQSHVKQTHTVGYCAACLELQSAIAMRESVVHMHTVNTKDVTVNAHLKLALELCTLTHRQHSPFADRSVSLARCCSILLLLKHVVTIRRQHGRIDSPSICFLNLRFVEYYRNRIEQFFNFC